MINLYKLLNKIKHNTIDNLAVSPGPDKDSIPYMEAVDVAEKIRMQEELRLKDSAMEASMNAIAILDLNYRVIYANESFVRIFGYKDKNDAVGREAAEFIVFNNSFLPQQLLYWRKAVFPASLKD